MLLNHNQRNFPGFPWDFSKKTIFPGFPGSVWTLIICLLPLSWLLKQRSDTTSKDGIREYSNDVRMGFGLDKCNKLTIKKDITIASNDFCCRTTIPEQHHQTNRQQGWNGRFSTSIMNDKKKSWKRTSAARTPSMLSTRLQHQITRTRLQYSTG